MLVYAEIYNQRGSVVSAIKIVGVEVTFRQFFVSTLIVFVYVAIGLTFAWLVAKVESDVFLPTVAMFLVTGFITWIMALQSVGKKIKGDAR